MIILLLFTVCFSLLMHLVSRVLMRKYFLNKNPNKRKNFNNLKAVCAIAYANERLICPDLL